MGEKFPQKSQASSEAFFKKKEKKMIDFEKGITTAEAIQAECMATIDRLNKDVGGNDYMIENADKYMSYRALRNYALSMMDRAGRMKDSFARLEHDAREEEQN